MAAALGLVEVAHEQRVVDAQVGRLERHVGRAAPFARANSRMPLTELWLSNVARNRLSRRERVRLADEPQRARGVRREDAGVLALGRVKWRSTAARACSTSTVAADEVGLTECGLP